MSAYCFEPIGFVSSPYGQKFGIPRQPGLAPDVPASIRLVAPFDQPDCVRGLADFDHIWIQFVFHGNGSRGWAPLVRPPRLGGSRKMGVFATRSPHRPNPIGLSLVRLLRVDTVDGICLHIVGADLMDGTPVLDIKPYIPFVESRPEAKAGFVEGAPAELPIVWSDMAQAQLAALPDRVQLQLIIEQSLSQDPRPAFHEENRKEYGALIQGINVKFRVDERGLCITKLLPGESR